MRYNWFLFLNMFFHGCEIDDKNCRICERNAIVVSIARVTRFNYSAKLVTLLIRMRCDQLCTENWLVKVLAFTRYCPTVIEPPGSSGIPKWNRAADLFTAFATIRVVKSSFIWAVMRTHWCVLNNSRASLRGNVSFLRQRKTLSPDERRTIRMLQFRSRLLPAIRMQESAQLGLKIKIFRIRWLHSNIGVTHKERNKNFSFSQWNAFLLFCSLSSLEKIFRISENYFRKSNITFMHTKVLNSDFSDCHFIIFNCYTR